MEFTVSTDHILWFCGLITALWGVWKIIKEIKKPSEDLKIEVDKHTELLNNDHMRLKELEQTNKMILQCLLILIEHEITGNSATDMRKMREDLISYLAGK